MNFELLNDEVAGLAALGEAYGNLGRLFVAGEGDVTDLRLGAAACRQGADLLDRIADRLSA